MHDLFIRPSEAIDLLMHIHRQRSPLRARQNLLGALRAGVIEWRCEGWSEIYVAENGATFDEVGGESSEEPKYGWPPDFWQPKLATDNPLWAANHFVLNDEVNLLTARRKVQLWLDLNGGGVATRTRTAKQPTIKEEDVVANLGGAGWSTWSSCERTRQGRPPAPHYVEALVRMIGRAVRAPDEIRNRPLDCLREAFEVGGRVPDDAQLKPLAARIRDELTPPDDPPTD